MLERLTPVLRLVCIGLAALILYQVTHVLAHKDPLENLSVAAAYAMLDAADSPPATAPTAPGMPTANQSASMRMTPATNAATLPSPSTNVSRATNTAGTTNLAQSTNTAGATNQVAARPPPPMMKPQSDLSPAVQARVDRVTQSEILGPVIRPLPMALIGIAGKDVLLRTANGQTGLLREGEELGGVKLLRIGTNRVLIEHEHQQKELTVFAGVGGESLLPKPEKKPQ